MTSAHVVLSCIFHCSFHGRIRRVRVHLFRCSARRSLRPGPHRLLGSAPSTARSTGHVRGRRDVCCLLASEALARAGVRGVLVVLEVTMHGGKRPDGSLVSMVLTSTLHRCCAPRKNRSIPTISAGNIDGRLVHVSAVGTGPRRSESEVLTAEPGASATGPPPPLPDRRVRWGLEVRVRRRLRPESVRVGLLHEGRDLLTTGCAYCTKAPPTRSTPSPRPVAPHPRAVHPDDAGSHHSHRAGPLRQSPSSSPPIRQTHPTSVLRSHDTRHSQKT